jgi:kynureninase
MSVDCSEAQSEDYARHLDATDALADMRANYALPIDASGAALAYLSGHSLGLAPRAARALVEDELRDWEQLGVLGHEHAHRPWIGYAELLQPDLAMLAGAHAHEVVAMNSLTVNLHLLLASFYRPTAQRYRILVEAGAFPSDRHVVISQLRWHGHEAADALIELAPHAGEDLLRSEDVERSIAAAGDSLALVLWPGVQYRTGQAFDMSAITRAAHAAGALVCLDLAHAIGNLPLSLHDWQVDCAAWCSYKYLNAGPGALGGVFIHERQLQHRDVPRLEGWWGHDAGSRFAMSPEFAPGAGAAAWQLSNPPIFSSAPLLASLADFRRAGMSALRSKSIQLTAYLQQLLEARCGDSVQLVTPSAAAERGCQLSVRVRGGPRQARAVFDALLPHGVVGDWREPDIIRLAPVPLYNSYHDAWRAADALTAVLAVIR